MSRTDGTGRPAGMSWDVEYVLRFRFVALIVLLGVTAVLGLQILNLRMTGDPLESMYLEGHEFLPTLQAISEMVPESRMLVALLEVKDGDIYNNETVNKVAKITRRLMNIEGILPGGITSLNSGFDYFDNSAEGLSIEPVLGHRWPETPEEFEILKRRVAVSPMGLGRYVAYDGTVTMLTASLADIRREAEKAYLRLSDGERAKVLPGEYEKQEMDRFLANLHKETREIKAQEDDDKHSLHFMGAEVIQADMTAMGMQHVSAAAVVMMVLVIVLLAFYLRSFMGVLVPLIAMVVSLVWSLGIFVLARMEFNPMALLFPLMLGVLSMAYGTLVMKRYCRACDQGEDKKQAMVTAYGDTPVAGSIIAAGLVTLSLSLAPVPMIKDLGALGLFGLVGAFAAVVLIVPILISYLPDQGQGGRQGGASQSIARILIKLCEGKGSWLVLIILFAVLAVGGYCSGKLVVGDNIPGSSYLRADHPWNQCFNLMAEKFMGPFQLLVYARARDQGGFLDPEAINAVGEFSSYLKEEVGARDSIAFDMMVQMARLMLMDGNPKWQTVPISKEQVEGLSGLVMEQGGVEDFMDKTFSQAVISPFFPGREEREINEYVSMMQNYIDSHPSDKVTFSLGGGLLGMTKAVNDGVREAYGKVLIASFFAVLILSTLVTGSVLQGLIVTLSVVAAQAVVRVMMAGAGMPVSMPVVPAVAVSAGFGVLFGCHLLRRITAASSSSVEYAAAAGKGMEEAGGEVIFLGLLVFAASLPWFFIGLKFQSNMVLALGVTVLTASLTSVLFVPALVDLLKPPQQ